MQAKLIKNKTFALMALKKVNNSNAYNKIENYI